MLKPELTAELTGVYPRVSFQEGSEIIALPTTGLSTFDWRRFLGTFGGKPESAHEKKTAAAAACI